MLLRGVVVSCLPVVALLLAAAVGCQSPRPPFAPSSTTRMDDVDALRFRRLNGVTARLKVTELEVTLSRRDGFGAWAWPGGPIHVSRDLVDLLDDDELAAVVAHELGHLRGGKQWSGPLASLDGDGGLETESRADQLGCRLLVARGIEPTATVRLLDKLSVVLGSPTEPRPFAARTARARAVCAR